MHGLMFFHHKHGNGAERSPSAHFLCYNVVNEWKNTWGCRSAQKPVGKLTIGLKLCNMNKASFGTTLNVLGWPRYSTKTQSKMSGETRNHPFDLKKFQKIWEKECQNIPKSKCKFLTINPRRQEAVNVAKCAHLSNGQRVLVLVQWWKRLFFLDART